MEDPLNKHLSAKRVSTRFGSQLFYKTEKQFSLSIFQFPRHLAYQSVCNRISKSNPNMTERGTRSSLSISTWVIKLPSHFLHHLLP